MSSLEAVGASVRFGRLDAVADVSITVPDGGSVGIVGESGSGKTTLARALVGVQPLSAGTILLDGDPLPVRRTRGQRRAIQMVYQDPYSSLNPRMTVGQVLGELLASRGVASRAERRVRAAELLARVRLDEPALDAYPRQFSGGQRQRIALARALAVEPSVLVADEPTSALDASVQAVVIELLAGLRRDLGVTLVVVTHDLGVVNALCDQVAVMRAGRVVESGPTAAFFARPAEAYSRALLAAVPRLPLQGEPNARPSAGRGGRKENDGGDAD